MMACQCLAEATRGGLYTNMLHARRVEGRGRPALTKQYEDDQQLAMP